MRKILFEWHEKKDVANQKKHGVGFLEAQGAFFDPNRIIAADTRHSSKERRFFCIGRIGDGILTVRFTFRNNRIRIIGAGFWRKGKEIYEEENLIH